jgi:hypothetical protein
MALTVNTDQLMNDARCIDKCIPDGEKMSVLLSVLYQLQQNGTGGGTTPNAYTGLLAIDNVTGAYKWTPGFTIKGYRVAIVIPAGFGGTYWNAGDEIDVTSITGTTTGQFPFFQMSVNNNVLTASVWAVVAGNETGIWAQPTAGKLNPQNFGGRNLALATLKAVIW